MPFAPVTRLLAASLEAEGARLPTFREGSSNFAMRILARACAGHGSRNARFWSPKYSHPRHPNSVAAPAHTQRSCRMNQTSEKARPITLINVFTVEPVNQQRLVDLLIRATEGSVNRARGFISSTLHRS